jgi:ATP-binding cassette, subfamily B, bacterial
VAGFAVIAAISMHQQMTRNRWVSGEAALQWFALRVSIYGVSVYRRTLRYFRPYRRQSALALFLTVCGIGLNLLKPWPFKFIVDDVLPSVQQGRSPAIGAIFGGASVETVLLLLCLLIVMLHLLVGLVNLSTNLIFVKVGLQALLRLRTELYAYLQALPLKFHDASRTADSSFRVAYDSQSIQTIYNRGFTNIFTSGLTLVGTLVIMLNMDWQLTLASLSVLPFIAGAIYYYSDRIRRESTSIQEHESAVLAVAQEGLSSIRMVHAFGREEYEVSQFRKRAHESMLANLKFTRTSVVSTLVAGTLMGMAIAMMYYLGSLHVLQNKIKLGELLVFSAYLVMLYQPIEALTHTAWALEGAAAGAQRCFEVLDKEDAVKDAPGAVAISSTKGAIDFDKAAFGYSPDRLILRSINLSITPGETVAFVGGTGAGKSTLLSLVPRFYDPTSGRVLLDAKDIREITKKSLRTQISIVLQDTLLFSTTIRENIAYGRPDATEEEIIEAAKRAQAHDFIMAMPDNYTSQVGERGSHLSVGQRQRIGIARAFLKNAPILLLDEPTSALDPSTEQAIMETIKQLMQGRTTLIVTHRVATIHSMQKIVVLERGTIAEEGTGEELLARGGLYAKLYRAASGTL